MPGADDLSRSLGKSERKRRIGLAYERAALSVNAFIMENYAYQSKLRRARSDLSHLFLLSNGPLMKYYASSPSKTLVEGLISQGRSFLTKEIKSQSQIDEAKVEVFKLLTDYDERLNIANLVEA